jgi:hypothetical protein
LNLDGQSLQLYSYRGHVEVLTEAVYSERKQVAAPSARESALKLKKAGLK